MRSQDGQRGDDRGGAKVNSLHVVPGATFGGPHNEIMRLAPALEEAGFEPIVVLPLENGNAADRLRLHGIRVVHEKMTRLRRVRSAGHWLWYPVGFIRDVITLRRLIRMRKVGLVHGYGPNLQAAIAARLTSTPVVWSLLDIGAPAALRWLIGRLLPLLADSVLLNGRAMAEYYPGIRRMGGRAVVYYPPVDLDLFVPRRNAADPDGGAVVVGTLANLNPDKGLETLIDAAAILRSRAGITFFVYGATHATHVEYARDLAERAQRMAGNALTFRGQTGDPARALRTFDIFVISSIREGTTSTGLEAMACGLPVVATNVGGIPEIVKNGETGILVKPRAPGELAAAIELLAADPVLRRTMGRNGRSRVETEFGLGGTTAAFRGAYATAMERRSANRR